MGLSSNSIVHFTKSKESLKGILAENFRLKYCHERLRLAKTDGPVLGMHIPMVSFCDIPLSQMHRHIDNYGEYGIGLTREWAVRKRMNPVLYVQTGSRLSESYLMALKAYIDSEKNDFNESEIHLLDVLRYAKVYEGALERGGCVVNPCYRFSDEREWRYVPPHSSDLKGFYLESGFEDAEQRNLAQQAASLQRLEFEPDDIRYIVIRDESEIHEFIKHLDEVKGQKYTKRAIEILTSRIVTAKQIRTDF
jgi:hypothetical protein